MDKLRYFDYEDVDPDKWDDCLLQAPNSLVYAQSWYLDKLCQHWGALILGDYRYVMPVVWNRKWGFTYLYQPLFCQQLGIFPPPTPEIARLFQEELQRRYPFAEINLNAMHLPVGGDVKLVHRYNYLLSLAKPYPELSGNYSKHTQRNLKKTDTHQLNLISDVPIREFLQFKKENMTEKISREGLGRLYNVLAFATSRNMGQIYGVYGADNALCAAAFFIRYKKRVTYLVAASSKEGKKTRAMYFLIDRFIAEHAGKDYLLDFEGSMLPGVARLYKGFGATSESYTHLSWNHLPAYVKWLKR